MLRYLLVTTIALCCANCARTEGYLERGPDSDAGPHRDAGQCSTSLCNGICCGDNQQCINGDCVKCGCGSQECGADACGDNCGACSGQTTCTASGMCACSAGHTKCGNDCCSVVESCIYNTCCPNSQACAGACCSLTQSCIGGTCCSTPCNGTCCAAGATCISGLCTVCGCDDRQCGSDACGNSCGSCVAPRTCNGSGQCVISGCTPSQTPCGSDCCDLGTACIGGACCPTAQICGSTCCGAGQTCIAGICTGTCANTLCNGTCCLAGQTCKDNQCHTPDACNDQCTGTTPYCYRTDGVCQCTDTSCPSGSQCISGACTGTGDAGCRPTSCTRLGFNCGPAPDGCGGTLDCGTCTACGQTCGGLGVPNVCGGTCCPLTCQQMGRTCGQVGDGCGSVLNCGACSSMEVCTSAGQCVANHCGPGQTPCGSTCCDAAQTCLANACCPSTQACGNNCCGAGQSCVNGACAGACSTVMCNGVCCAAGQNCVNNLCHSSDPCGGLCSGATPVCDPVTATCQCTASSCPAGQPCVNGVCQCLCPANKYCDASGACVGLPDYEWAQWPVPPQWPTDYTDDGDGTVTDNVTNLLWQQMVPSQLYGWSDAITYCSTLQLAGKTGWRLPTAIELLSIVDTKPGYPSINPAAINSAMFPNTPGGNGVPSPGTFFWTATLYINDPGFAWSVGFDYGATFKSDTSSASSVRCVWTALPAAQVSAPGAPVGQFTMLTGQTVKDNKTGLTWMQEPAYTYDLNGAITYCNSYFLGINWRLPTKKELETLVDRRATSPNPTIDSTLFPWTTPGYFWTSTPFAGYAGISWVVGFDSGSTTTSVNSAKISVRCVH